MKKQLWEITMPDGELCATYVDEWGWPLDKKEQTPLEIVQEIARRIAGGPTGCKVQKVSGRK